MPKYIESKEKLKNEDKLFIEEYLSNGLKRKDAAFATRPGIKSEHAARQTAYAILKRPEVREYLEKRLGEIILSTNQVLARTSLLAENAKLDRDRLKALEMLGKFHKLFTDRTEHSGTVSVATFEITTRPPTPNE